MLFLILLIAFSSPTLPQVPKCPSECSCLGSYVDCSRLDLTSVPSDLPSWAESIDLHGNRLENVLSNAFAGLPHLQKLDLSFNQISSFSRSLLANLPQLTRLSLRKNSLTAVPRGIESVARLMELDLDLSNNRIRHLQANSFASLSTLRDLRLSRNRFNELGKDTFKGLISLRRLDLNRNRLKIIEGLTFRGLTNLEILNLERNGLKTLEDGAFWGLDGLKELFLRSNHLTSVANGWLYGAVSLLILDLSLNHIAAIDPTSWSYCSSLRQLNLSSNRLKTLSNGNFLKLVHLLELNLSNNNLEWIEDGTFDDLQSMQTLDLSGNSLSISLEDSARPFSAQLGQLKVLDLSQNRLRTIPSRSFYRLKALKSLNLDGNPLTSLQLDAFQGLNLDQLLANTSSLLCDCALNWLPSWLNSHPLSDPPHLLCGHPLSLLSQSLYSLHSMNMTCDDSPKPSIFVQPRSKSGLIGGDIHFGCKAWTGDQLDHRLVVQWKVIQKGKSRRLYPEPASLEIRNNLTVPDEQTGSSRTLVDSELLLTSLNEDDAADYQCVISNRFGTAYSRRASLSVLVHPAFVKTPVNMTLISGKNARLECSATGRPRPVLRWRKDGGEDFPAARERRMHVMPKDDVFFIVNVRSRDSGRYTCTASNEAGQVQATVFITVLEKPSFRQPLEDKTATIGSTVVLGCVAEGSPAPKIEWYYNGAKVKTNSRISLTAERQMLVIVNALKSDTGEYACEISSSLGAVRQSASLTVIDGDSESALYGNISTTLPIVPIVPIKSRPHWWSFDWPALLGLTIIIVFFVVVSTSLVWVAVIWFRLRLKKRPKNSRTTKMTRNDALIPMEKKVSDKDNNRGISAPDSRPGCLVVYADGSRSFTSSSLRNSVNKERNATKTRCLNPNMNRNPRVHSDCKNPPIRHENSPNQAIYLQTDQTSGRISSPEMHPKCNSNPELAPSNRHIIDTENCQIYDNFLPAVENASPSLDSGMGGQDRLISSVDSSITDEFDKFHSFSLCPPFRPVSS